MYRSMVAATAALCFGQLSVASMNMVDYKFEQQRRAWAYIEGAMTGKVNPNPDTSNYLYLNKNTSSFLIKSMPEVNYDLGEMYGGSIPIDENDPSRTLYFIFKPAIDANAPKDEITVFLNGGPGCSSMDGFFQENGPFTWLPGTFLPVSNPYSWANLTSMLWVEQPVGTGFSQGEIRATSEKDIAKDFVSWFKNFEQRFGIKNYKVRMTGESYAGRYVPYISAEMLDQNDKEYFDLVGALIYDGVIGNFVYTQEEVVAYPFALAHNEDLNLSPSFLAKMEKLFHSCGYAELIDRYLTFPPPGHQPAKLYEARKAGDCHIFDSIYVAALEINPCFNIYEVNQQCPLLWDVLGFPTGLVYVPDGATVYFNRTDVKKAINAPLDVNWALCSEHQVIKGKSGPEPQYHDDSPDPIQTVLPQVIEATNRVLIANGDLDMIIITNGSLLAIQNMTWNGKLGFQSKPTKPINIHQRDLAWQSVYNENGAHGLDGPQGIMGIQHYERGLMWAETYLSGHEGPEFQPRVSLRHLKWLLGLTDTL